MPATTSEAKSSTPQREDLIAHLNEAHVQAVYRALGVDQFKSGGPDHWLVRTPWRADHNPSLSIRKADGLWHDHATGDGDSIFAAVMRTNGCDFPESLAFVADVIGYIPHPNGTRPKGNPRVVATYDYRDEAGALLYQVERLEPKSFRQRRPDGNDGWRYDLGGVRRVLYRLPELAQAEPERWVLLCEGEKDADRLAGLAFVATTSAMGAGKWAGGYSESLRGRRVAILPDNDDPGHAHARRVARDIAGIAAEVRIVELPLGPRLPKGGHDVSDWLDADGTAAELKRLVSEAPVWTPDEAGEPDVEPESAPVAREWPDPPDPTVYHGIAGEIVRALEPATEADPVALLVSLLAAVGNIVGSGPHWQVSGSRHGLRIFPVMVGATAKGRKGTAWASVRAVLDAAAPDWRQRRVASGLSSGEGLIWAVRDPIIKSVAVKEHGRIVGYEDETVDAGVDDKRLFVIEEEFASVLRVMGRDGNTLSAIIRQAWDNGDLRTLTKNSPAVASGAHISILGHITQDELLRYLDSTEAGNGFANRFLWLCVRRSKLLPDGGNLDMERIDHLGARLGRILTAAPAITIRRDEAANELWREVYGPLSDGGLGLLGAVLSRAEAQVMRLAAIYALLDESTLIRRPHLLAALDLWDYCERSGAYIFGDTLGDPTADTILSTLRQGGPMTRNEIVNLFGRNVSRARLDRALGTLLEAGKVRRGTDRGTGGRPAEVWEAVA